MMIGPVFGLFATGWVLVAAGTALTPETAPADPLAYYKTVPWEALCGGRTGRLMDQCLAKIDQCMVASAPEQDDADAVASSLSVCAEAVTKR